MIDTGSTGSKHIFVQLSANGLHAEALRLATQTTYPSFGYWLSQGATSCWEDWSGVTDASHVNQPTHNHIFLCGGLGEWMYKSISGITPIEPGFSRVRIAPTIDETIGPAGVNTSLDTPYGLVLVSYTRSLSPNTIKLVVRTPKTAVVVVPLLGRNVSDVTIKEGGIEVWVPPGKYVPKVRGIKDAKVTPDGKSVKLIIDPGSYSFETI